MAGAQFELAGLGERQAIPEDNVNQAAANHQAGVAEWLFNNDFLDRKLKREHISGIAFSGTIGVGIFITSGELIGISGSAGCVIAFAIAGLIIVAVMRSLAELVSVRPISGALIDYPHTFVDPALGFAVGVIYWLSQCMSMATLTSAAARVADTFYDDDPLKKSQKTGIIIGLCVITLLSNVCGVRLYGNIERVVKWLKMLLIIGVCVLMIGVNVGLGLAGRDRPSNGNNYTHNALPPNLTWRGINSTASQHGEPPSDGIAGGRGQFLGIWTSTIFAMFACMGGDIVIVTAGEAKEPRKDLPPATRFMYLAPICSYLLASFLVGFNVNFTEPNLFHPWADYNRSVSHSPFIIVLKYTTIKVLPNFINACFLFSAYTAANTSLFSSSRTLFTLAQNYGPPFLQDTLGKTSNGHTPVAAIIVCSLFGLLALVGLKDESYNQPILTLSAFFTSSVACVYASECVAFLRFYQGLVRHNKNRTFSRDSPEYKGKHYRAHWQPYWAIFALFACIMIIFFSGWPAVYLLSAGTDFIQNNKLKPQGYLVADVVGAYSGPILFFTLYAGYKILHNTHMKHFKDFENEYFLPEFDGENMATVTGPKWRWILHEVWSFIK